MDKAEELRAQLKSARTKCRRSLQLQVALVGLCWFFVGLAFLAWLLHAGFRTVVTLGLCVLPCVVGIWLSGFMARPFHALAMRLQKDLDELTGAEAFPAGDGLPCTLGFANLSDKEFEAFAVRDAEQLTPLFSRSHLVREYMMLPKADVLFVYAHLNEDGTVQDAPVSFGIRQLEQLCDAKLIVLASANTVESIKNAVLLPGPKNADLVFTLNRNGEGFVRFFRALFEKMQSGVEIQEAWKALTPKDPGVVDPNAPQAILLAEAGEVCFLQQADTGGV